MSLFRHELRQGGSSLAVWTAAIGALLAACLLLYPEMEGEMDAVGNLFASMGSFTAAFGMDRLDFGTLSGFYCVECGSILGLGGALFASLLGVSALAKEERGRTAELLLTHPVSRSRVAAEKLAAVLAQVTAMDLLLLTAALLMLRLIGQTFPRGEMLLLHGAYWLLHLEMACVCFGVSAFLRRGGTGLAMGLAAGAYFLELLANMTERADWLRYITPFGYCEGTELLAVGHPDAGRLAAGLALACAGVAAAFWQYGRKDIL